MGRLGYKIIIIIIIISWGKIGEGDWEGGRNKRKKDKKNINLLTFFAVLGGLWSYKAGLVPGLGLSQPDLDFKDSRYYFNFSHPLSDTHSESITSNHRFGIIHPLGSNTHHYVKIYSKSTAERHGSRPGPKGFSHGCLPQVLLCRVPVYWKLVSGPTHLGAITRLADFIRWEWTDFP